MTQPIHRKSPFSPRVAILFGCLFAQAGVFGADALSPHVDDSGVIHFPEDFRASMVHLGSWYVPEGEASGFHDVYTEAESAEAYRKTGRFPDGATIVKELRASTVGDYTTGANVSYANDDLKQWFVMIKDQEGRFGDNPNWGEGWGWALFKPGDRNRNVSTNFRTDCLGCHMPAKETDWIYTEAYPTLAAGPESSP
jgi:hypothetical protein